MATFYRLTSRKALLLDRSRLAGDRILSLRETAEDGRDGDAVADEEAPSIGDDDDWSILRRG